MITVSFFRSLQLGMIGEHVPASRLMSSENNHHKLNLSSAQRVSEPSIDIDSRPPAPLPPEVSAYKTVLNGPIVPSGGVFSDDLS